MDNEQDSLLEIFVSSAEIYEAILAKKLIANPKAREQFLRNPKYYTEIMMTSYNYRDNKFEEKLRDDEK